MEVDAPGCSYNPDKDHHEEVVAAAVAEEMQKGLDVEMRAKGPPKHVSWQPEVDPLLQLQVCIAHAACSNAWSLLLYPLVSYLIKLCMEVVPTAQQQLTDTPTGLLDVSQVKCSAVRCLQQKPYFLHGCRRTHGRKRILGMMQRQMKPLTGR